MVTAFSTPEPIVPEWKRGLDEATIHSIESGVEVSSGVLTTVPVAKLMIDKDYQRPVSNTFVGELVNDFNSSDFGVLNVSMRADGRFYVIDGQHRLEAARLLGLERVPCFVHRNLTPKEEARIFSVTGTKRRNLMPIDRMRAKIASGDKQSHHIKQIVERHGFELALNWVGGDGRIVAIGSLERIYTHYRQGPDILDLSFQAIAEAWGNDTKFPPSPVLLGLAHFINRYRSSPNFDWDRMIAIMGKHTPTQWNAKGREQQVVAPYDKPTAVSRAIWLEFNKYIRKMEHRLFSFDDFDTSEPNPDAEIE